MVTLNLDPIIKLTSEQFYQLCQHNPDIKLERSATGQLHLMSPTGWETGRVNTKINLQLALWNEQTQLGEVFDSSTGFDLPNGSDRSPDAAWIAQERWCHLTPEQREKFLPLCPEFAVEILSPSDSLPKTQAKIQEYLDNGCRLGWLINRKQRQVKVYRPGQPPEVLEAPTRVSGEEVLSGLCLDLKAIW
ncbi:MAG: Uma2 family endonuclease [Roseofilum sp. SBFL]|uniref:Uma2 family endonuclease n=1 Tax=unclassified Roseofilum TaxID=2620099 RepID=UPI001B2F0987|nr:MULTISPECIES: Uma2 family endonuclease [unclassified Roseofilum]MBP0015853.1 Uma2 family endonuclease [Roseofilum sp. SID3]MBP0025413.1 Uma2 family endonuclease [Roseofilum sp. SID2]MBP0038671.1 Uma2 family endonuclease [Roseofilum sp. SID1]MBP0043821.1 Uma2 family endonuclease [Roseofilum sp. SBFL]